MALTADQLKQIIPTAPKSRIDRYLEPLQEAMDEFEINNRLRQAAFLAQLAHESGGLRYMEELATGAAYEGRKDLGNTQKGDGKRFKGRGPIQITGRANYKKYGELLGLDLINDPEMAAHPDVGFRLAGAFWKDKGLNDLADHGFFKKITERINGGLNGFEDRKAYYARALVTLKDEPADTGDNGSEPAPTGDSSTPAPAKPDNPAPQDIVMQPTATVDATSQRSFRTMAGTAIAAAGAWVTANVGEAMGWIKNLDINQFMKWLMILAAAVVIVYLLRQIVKMIITQVGNISYNLMSMWSHANQSTNNVKLASPAPREEVKE